MPRADANRPHAHLGIALAVRLVELDGHLAQGDNVKLVADANLPESNRRGGRRAVHATGESGWRWGAIARVPFVCTRD